MKNIIDIHGRKGSIDQGFIVKDINLVLEFPKGRKRKVLILNIVASCLQDRRIENELVTGESHIIGIEIMFLVIGSTITNAVNSGQKILIILHMKSCQRQCGDKIY